MCLFLSIDSVDKTIYFYFVYLQLQGLRNDFVRLMTSTVHLMLLFLLAPLMEKSLQNGRSSLIVYRNLSVKLGEERKEMKSIYTIKLSDKPIG